MLLTEIPELSMLKQWIVIYTNNLDVLKNPSGEEILFISFIQYMFIEGSICA